MHTAEQSHSTTKRPSSASRFSIVLQLQFIHHLNYQHYYNIYETPSHHYQHLLNSDWLEEAFPEVLVRSGDQWIGSRCDVRWSLNEDIGGCVGHFSESFEVRH